MEEKILFDLDDLRNRLSCKEMVENMYGRPVRGNRCQAWWRNSQDYNIQLNNDGTFKDFVTGDHGNCAAMYAVIEHTTLAKAANLLGRRLGMQDRKKLITNSTNVRKEAEIPEGVMPNLSTIAPPVSNDIERFEGLPIIPAPANNQYEMLLQDGFTVVAQYDYKDANGNTSYRVIRLEKGKEKQFLQCVPNVGWGLMGIEKLLYNLPSVINASTVYIAEGEKNAQFLIDRGYCATTNSGGAKNWEKHFNCYLLHKEVIILADNDEAGKIHAYKIAQQLLAQDFNAKVKIVIPSAEEKGDIVNWLEKGHTNDDFDKLCARSPYYKRARLGAVTSEMISAAKERNKTPFSNYYIKLENDNNGKKKNYKIPLTPQQVYDDLMVRLLGYPMRIGSSTLFDFDRDTHTMIPLNNASALFAWIGDKTGLLPEWDNSGYFVSKNEFFELLLQKCHAFNMQSDVPEYPLSLTTYYTFNELPKPSNDHHYFWDFVNFFNPDGEINRLLIAAFIITPMWNKGFRKPMWVIDSDEGRAVGKTTLVERVGWLYSLSSDPHIIVASRNDFTHSREELCKRIVSSSGRQCHILLLDNLTDKFSSDTLASWITGGAISGRPPYGRGEESRENNLTYVITSNDVMLDKDLVTRSFFISLCRPKVNPKWTTNIINYTQKYRFYIFADMIDMLENHNVFDKEPISRFPEFEQDVIQCVCSNEEEYVELINHVAVKKEESCSDADELNVAVDILRRGLASVKGINPSSDYVWIQCPLVAKWGRDNDTKLTAAHIRDMIKDLSCNNLVGKIKQFPDGPDGSLNKRLRVSGIMWRGENVTPNEFGRYKVIIVGIDGKDRVDIKAIIEGWNGDNRRVNPYEYSQKQTVELVGSDSSSSQTKES